MPPLKTVEGWIGDICIGSGVGRGGRRGGCGRRPPALPQSTAAYEEDTRVTQLRRGGGWLRVA